MTRLIVIAWAVLCVACEGTSAATQIVVAVDSNLTIGSELDRLVVRIFDSAQQQDGQELRMQTFALTAQRDTTALTLPVTFRLEPEREDDERDFRLVVTGIGPVGDGTQGPVVEQQVFAAFRRGEARRIDVFLSRTCLQTLCRASAARSDLTCERSAGSCAVVPSLTDLVQATNSATAGYAPRCDLPPLCVAGALRTCSADGTREEYAACPPSDDPCIRSACIAGEQACSLVPAWDAPPSCSAVDAGGRDAGHDAGMDARHDAGGDAGVSPDAGMCDDETTACCDGGGCMTGPCGNAPVNPCGGCTPLAQLPGAPCNNRLLGACLRTGRIVCTSREAVSCDAASAPPTEEVCNGLDDDCDGLPDDEIEVQCFEGSGGEMLTGTPGMGQCQMGIRTCMSGTLGPCVGAIGASAEQCGNEQDEDCDGTRCSLAAVTLLATGVEDEAYLRSADATRPEACRGKDLACDLRAFVLAQPNFSNEGARAETFTLRLANADCGATAGDFALDINGTRHELPSQTRLPRTHCGITHLVRFTVDFLAGTHRVDFEDRCPFEWSCSD